MRESLHHEAANSTVAFPLLKMIRTALSLALFLDIQHRAIHFITEMAIINYAPSLYEPRATDTCTPTTSTKTNPVFTDCAPSSESQAKPSAEEAANLLSFLCFDLGTSMFPCVDVSCVDDPLRNSIPRIISAIIQ